MVLSLHAGKIERPQPKPQLYAALHCNAEDDPGNGEVRIGFIKAATDEAALNKFYRVHSEEFSYVSIWPVENLIDYLTDQLKGKKGRKGTNADTNI